MAAVTIHDYWSRRCEVPVRLSREQKLMIILGWVEAEAALGELACWVEAVTSTVSRFQTQEVVSLRVVVADPDPPYFVSSKFHDEWRVQRSKKDREDTFPLAELDQARVADFVIGSVKNLFGWRVEDLERRTKHLQNMLARVFPDI